MYDLIVIGAGWAGFNAALTAKKLGLKTCLIDQSEIGGTCLNRGCIPAKSLLQSAKIYALSKKSAAFGIENSNTRIDFSRIQQRKQGVIEGLRRGMQSMLKGVDFVGGRAEILSPGQVRAADKVLETKYILIACGSLPAQLPGFKFDGGKIISSDDALNLASLPKSILIVGGGVIGCEFAGLFSTLGASVEIAEKMPLLLPGVDNEIARKLELAYKKRSVKVNTNCDASSIDLNKFDTVLVCVGRSCASNNLGLEKIGLKTERGRIVVDECLKTNIDNIYAAGDVTGKVMLAHFAAYQGIIAGQNIFNSGSPGIKADNPFIPNCIFSDPEIAGVGLDEEAAKARGYDPRTHKFDFLGSGMARIIEETEGFVKIISDKKTGIILGASIIGPKATELIAGLAIAASNKLTVSQVRNTIFGHPTLSETIGEALKEI